MSRARTWRSNFAGRRTISIACRNWRLTWSPAQSGRLSGRVRLSKRASVQLSIRHLLGNRITDAGTNRGEGIALLPNSGKRVVLIAGQPSIFQNPSRSGRGRIMGP